MFDLPYNNDFLPDFDGEDNNRGDTDLPPVRLAQFEIAPGVFVTISSLTGETPSPKDLDLSSFNEFLGIQESEATRNVRGLEEGAPPNFDFAGKNSRGPFSSRQEVASFLDKTGLAFVANVYVVDMFTGEAPDDDVSEDFYEWWIDIDTGGTD